MITSPVKAFPDVSYVTFNLPQSSQGGLYYGYTSAGQYAGRVSTSGTKYSLSSVCWMEAVRW